MAGLLDGLFPKVPDPKRVDLDPETQGLLNDSVTRASQDPAAFAAQANQGVDERAGQLNQSQSGVNQLATGRGEDPAMLQAIERVYSGKAQDQINRIKSNNDINAPLRKSQALQGISAASLGAQQAKNQFYQQLTDAYNQSETNRAQLVSTLFQIGTQGYMMGSKHIKPGLSMNMGPGQSAGAQNFNQDPFTLA